MEIFQEKRLISTVMIRAAISRIIRMGSFGIFFAMRIPTSRISRPTATRMPRKALATQAISRNRSRNMEMSQMIMKDGSTTPSVAAMEPQMPFCL